MGRRCILVGGLAAMALLLLGLVAAQPVSDVDVAGAGGLDQRAGRAATSGPGLMASAQVRPTGTAPAFPDTGSGAGATGLGSAGSGFGNGFRVEAEGSHRSR